jgi:hypothetical protein
MAEETKKKKQEKKPADGLDNTELVILVFFGLAIAGGLLVRVTGAFEILKEGGFFEGGLGDLLRENVYPILFPVSFAVSALSVFGIVWSLMALTKINTAQNILYRRPILESVTSVETEKNRRWQKVLDHMNSSNPNDWKFAILEANIILDDLLNAMGYRGETIADKLKRVEKSDFDTLELAWEAHKIRNTIAHKGADFVITEREARRVIDLYRKVFEEFRFI